MEMSHGDTGEVMDPVCGMTVEPATAAAHRSVGGRDFWFCGEGCAQKFEQNPSAFSKSD
jgi:Cu+-exporting ATPase